DYYCSSTDRSGNHVF
nr:immunoglobulin light chain junction region [Macaca mulatta]MOV72716.1 immunoglobulin light chain junction region [Macaca mulatta]MOV73083.1 immunoglobulin light chain junction region [Macaca mulatta]MOV73260.1 immunoglobulin light chain junction region [Macaca mulatta]MOV73738.1 immunoglobulin light chain junction region [Macaca mulatta]